MEQQSANQGQLIGQRFGKYDLLALLAIGGTAEIYLARIGGEAGFEKFVVCKCLLDHLADEPEYVHMFLDEARIGAQLDHSNIVQTLELGEHNGRYYMVMEYLAGMSLSTMAKKAQERVPGGLTPDLALHLGAQACAGLHYAHERTSADGRPLNIIHRDVSPQNLVISFEGVLKLVDFGIAKAEMRETHTKSGTIKGKFAYMSPEQCLGHAIDRRTDIFALGTILHELLTGQRLFKRNNTYDTYQAIVNGEVVPPSHVNHRLDPGLDDVVMRALAYDREQRYPTAEAFGEALLQVLHRRGRSVGASDVARFCEQHFKEELEIHAARMRELITDGRATLNDITWNAPELASDSASQMPDEVPRAPSVDDSWGGDDEEPADEGGATRIEPNPLLRVQTMHAQQMKGGGQVPRAASPQPMGKARSRPSRPTSPGHVAVGSRPSGSSRPQTEDEAPTITGRPARQAKQTIAVPAVPMPLRPSPRPAPSAAPNPAPQQQSAPQPQQSAPPPQQSAPQPQQSAPPPQQSAPPQSAKRPETFPPVHTPTAFRGRAELLTDAPPRPQPGDDLFALAHQSKPTPPLWLLGVAFAVSLGVGLGATLLVSALL
jgi:serine/threonine protein kinase